MNIKIIVVDEQSCHRVLEMKDGLFSVRAGEHLNCLSDSLGNDFFFTKDGYYDGQGKTVSVARDQ